MEALKAAKIVPDMLDRVAEEQVEMTLDFGAGPIEDGALLTPEQAAQAPRVRISGGAAGGVYTLLHSDPDAPDPENPIRREWLHWIVTNIKGGDASSGQEIVPYMGPAPPIGTHRYVFMLYKQASERVEIPDPSGGKREGRPCFNTRKWAAEHGLGDPLAVAWFNSHK